MIDLFASGQSVTLAVLFLLTLLSGVISLSLYQQSVYAYRKLIPYSKYLLTKGVNLKIREYSDGRASQIFVCDKMFTEFLVFWNLRRDISELNDSDYEFVLSYYDERDNFIPVTKIFEKIELYNKKIVPWSNENQGRHDVSKKPEAPYCYIDKTLHVKIRSPG